MSVLQHRYPNLHITYAKRLIIEIDGGQHCGSEADLVRDAWLKQRSFNVLRFWNNEILENLDAVLTVILEKQSLIEPAPLRDPC